MAATHVFVNGVPLARGKFDLWMEGGGPQLVVDVTRPLELPQRVEKKTVKRPLSAGPRRRPQSALARPQSARIGRPATAKPPPPPKAPENETAAAIERLRKQLASKENKTVARLRKALAQEKELLKRERMLVTRERARVARLEKSAELAKRMSKKKGPTKKVDEEEDPYADDFVEPPVKKDDSWRGKHGRKKTAFLREAKGAVTPSKGDGFVLSPAFSPSEEPPKSPEERA